MAEPSAGGDIDVGKAAVQGQRVRVRWEDAARRATVSRPLGDDGKLGVTFEDTQLEAEVPADVVQNLEDFELKEPLHGITGALSVDEAAQLRCEADLLLKASDAQAAAERVSAAIQRMGLQLEGETSQVLVVRSREIWEGHCTQATEAGMRRVRFSRLLESHDYRQRKKDEREGKFVQKTPKDQNLPTENVCVPHLGKLGLEQIQLHMCRVRCWMALKQTNRGNLDCNVAAAMCRFQKKAPRRAPGFEITVPLLVLGLAMALAKQVLIGIACVIAAFVVDYLANQRADRAAADPQLSEVLALRGRVKLVSGLSSFADTDLLQAIDALGPFPEGRELRKLRKELRQFRKSEAWKERQFEAGEVERTWRMDAVDKVRVNAFLMQQEEECKPRAMTFGEMRARREAESDDEQQKFELGYMDYVGDGFQMM